MVKLQIKVAFVAVLVSAIFSILIGIYGVTSPITAIGYAYDLGKCTGRLIVWQLTLTLLRVVLAVAIMVMGLVLGFLILSIESDK